MKIKSYSKINLFLLVVMDALLKTNEVDLIVVDSVAALVPESRRPSGLRKTIQLCNS